MTDDAGCLRIYAERGDEGAFSEFVRRNLNLVYSAAIRQTGGDVHLAQDIAQGVFASAARKAGVLARHPVVGAWLHQATRYAAIDAVRARQRREAREKEVAQMTESDSAPEEAADWELVSPVLDRVVASLAEQDREAVILRFFGGNSFADIGARLQLSENAARMRVDRALEKLRVRLSGMGITSSCAALAAILTEHGVVAAPSALGPAAVAHALSASTAGGLAAASGLIQIMTTTKLTVTFAATASPGAPAAGRSGSGFAAMLDLLGNPAMQSQTEMLAKLRLDGQYAALFKSLNLTPSQIEQFKNLLVEKEMVGFDSMSAAHQQGIDPVNDPRGFFMAVAGAEKTVDSQISALLGADGFTQFQTYQGTVPARNTSNLLTQALSYTATPLTDAQTAGIIQALAQYGVPALPPDNPFAVLNGDLGITRLNDAGVAQLQGILSPEQFQVLQAKMDEANQLLQARIKMGR